MSFRKCRSYEERRSDSTFVTSGELRLFLLLTFLAALALNGVSGRYAVGMIAIVLFAIPYFFLFVFFWYATRSFIAAVLASGVLCMVLMVAVQAGVAESGNATVNSLGVTIFKDGSITRGGILALAERYAAFAMIWALAIYITLRATPTFNAARVGRWAGQRARSARRALSKSVSLLKRMTERTSSM